MIAHNMITINGRFLTQKVSGVQRYSREIIMALDRKLAGNSDFLSGFRLRLVAPRGTDCDLALKHIEFQTEGLRSGHVWEQMHLTATPGLIVNLGNSGPILKRNSMVVIHDAAVFRTPDNFGGKYARFHRFLGRALALGSTIGTVSEFSRRELSQVLKLDAADIFVAPNGADHMKNSDSDPGILERLSLAPQRFFLFVGSPTRNKNLQLALEAFARLQAPDARLVVVGSLANTVFRGGSDLNQPGVVLPGYLSDAEVSALYNHAAALVFPSLYEGFGIPPLEAMVKDCPVLASDIPPVKEVCGDAAQYFRPDDAERLAALMQERLDRPDERAQIVERSRKRADDWTWDRSAARLAEAIVRKAGRG